MASKRNYLSQSELAEFADITIIDTTEADDQISQAEELVDAFVGYQEKSLCSELQGKATAGSTISLTLQTDQQNVYENDYFTYCMVEVIGGTGKGQRSRISASTKAGVLTFDAVSTALDSTSIYKIWQLGKFPRKVDVVFDSVNQPSCYYKSIPEAVKRATASQVQYFIEMGSGFFSTDKFSKTRESIGNYEYEKADGSINDLIAPKTKLLLRGLKNIKGQFLP